MRGFALAIHRRGDVLASTKNKLFQIFPSARDIAFHLRMGLQLQGWIDPHLVDQATRKISDIRFRGSSCREASGSGNFFNVTHS